jgi:hypothetical protein
MEPFRIWRIRLSAPKPLANRRVRRPTQRHVLARAATLASRDTVADAVERRIRAEERLAQVRAELREALARSERAHLDAAEVDEVAGKHEAADRHRREAEVDRERRRALED